MRTTTTAIVIATSLFSTAAFAETWEQQNYRYQQQQYQRQQLDMQQQQLYQQQQQMQQQQNLQMQQMQQQQRQHEEMMRQTRQSSYSNQNVVVPVNGASAFMEGFARAYNR